MISPTLSIPIPYSSLSDLTTMLPPSHQDSHCRLQNLTGEGSNLVWHRSKGGCGEVLKRMVEMVS
ncbi:wall-associated receptor kinase-like 1 [Pyrus ussuriensis x Pyrus communis]|uniref:Wall-associated receptor kinase-like 1 n=1 Tax=Pyrus ussuriensis x Pyrus communis TaxID=2448454 RepID=A0A5N5FB15_9ROSA|nr:wall-associated receptor kinase-like 1 [Pyrus ussuriensis x Pyrus communis]